VNIRAKVAALTGSYFPRLGLAEILVEKLVVHAELRGAGARNARVAMRRHQLCARPGD